MLGVPVTNGSRRRLVFFSLLALLAGGSIYLFMRPGSFIFHHWLDAMGIDPGAFQGADAAGRWSGSLMEWILYSLPDGLWALAYTLLIFGLWAGSRSRARYFWYATIPLLVIGFESLQGIGIIRGTFSFSDLLTSMAGMISGVYIQYLIRKKPGHKAKLE